MKKKECVTMEAGDHFKNEASPKSLTSRENFNHLILYNMKRFTMSLANALMICLLLAAFSCSKEEHETMPDDPDVPTLPPAETETKSPYMVGDYYNVSGVKGAVFEISNNGKNGKIVSLDEEHLAWSQNYDEINAKDRDNGMNNMNVVKNISGWKSKYPAFKWCDEKNTNGITGWYYPAINELKSLYDSWNSVEDALVKYGENFKTNQYGSSTELDGDSYNDNGYYYDDGYSYYYNRDYYYYFNFNNGNIYFAHKSYNYIIRAIRKF
ncbi:MAG: DUF1566 domain-containing protein [Prevotellaceae bacterium]|jgi:hypothetical protein|nr:DUF1566 domain-containing protein [Prevotellaceae bacterium]